LNQLVSFERIRRQHACSAKYYFAFTRFPPGNNSPPDAVNQVNRLRILQEEKVIEAGFSARSML
jgi:hypothetical protein